MIFIEQIFLMKVKKWFVTGRQSEKNRLKESDGVHLVKQDKDGSS